MSAPVLMLTSRNGVRDRVRGLDASATTIFVEPFGLLDWLRGCGRWPAATTSTAIMLAEGDARLNQPPSEHYQGGVDAQLWPKEFSCWSLSCGLGHVLGCADHRGGLGFHLDDDFQTYRPVCEPCGADRRAVRPPWISTVEGIGYRLRRAGQGR